MLVLKRFLVVREDVPLFSPLDATLSAGVLNLLRGPNGRGKTTMLRALVGVHRFYSGEFIWSTQSPPVFIGHQLGLHTAMTLMENMRQLYAIYQLPWQDIDPVLLQLQLLGFDDVPVGRLSAGQQRKLALAPLLHPLLASRPWILDEPLTSLDRQTCAWVESRLVDHIQGGGFALVTSHQALSSPKLAHNSTEIHLKARAQ